ncbi:MAG: hypothetical protein AABY99_01680, partial [Pseudomonadota bacterium]
LLAYRYRKMSLSESFQHMLEPGTELVIFLIRDLALLCSSTWPYCVPIVLKKTALSLSHSSFRYTDIHE